MSTSTCYHFYFDCLRPLAARLSSQGQDETGLQCLYAFLDWKSGLGDLDWRLGIGDSGVEERGANSQRPRTERFSYWDGAVVERLMSLKVGFV